MSRTRLSHYRRAVNFVSLEEILPEFESRVRRIVYSQMATMDAAGRPRIRVVHIVWDRITGYLSTAPGAPKLTHIARNPSVSLGYWDPAQTTVTVDCRAIEVTDAEEKTVAYRLFVSEPEPYGFDPAFWGGTPDDPAFALIRFEPWRIELAGYPTLWNWESKVWTAQP